MNSTIAGNLSIDDKFELAGDHCKVLEVDIYVDEEFQDRTRVTFQPIGDDEWRGTIDVPMWFIFDRI